MRRELPFGWSAIYEVKFANGWRYYCQSDNAWYADNLRDLLERSSHPNLACNMYAALGSFDIEQIAVVNTSEADMLLHAYITIKKRFCSRVINRLNELEDKLLAEYKERVKLANNAKQAKHSSNASDDAILQAGARIAAQKERQREVDMSCLQSEYIIVYGKIYHDVNSACSSRQISKRQLAERINTVGDSAYDLYAIANSIDTAKALQAKQETIMSASTNLKCIRYRPIEVAGVVYKSAKLAAEDVGVTVSTIYNRCNSANWPNYRFLDTDKATTAQPVVKHNKSPKSAIACEVDSVVYASITDAAFAHHIAPATAKQRCLSDDYPTWKILDK